MPVGGVCMFGLRTDFSRGSTGPGGRAVRATALFAASGCIVAVAAGGVAVAGGPKIAPDPSFDGGHNVTLDFPQPAGGTSTNDGEAMGAVFQADGKLLVAGSNPSTSPTGLGDFDVARLNANGTLDTSFGSEHTGYVSITPKA